MIRRLFKWLDRDNDDFIDENDLVFGISKIMIRDVDFKEVKFVFQKYDVKKLGKIDLNSFMLAIANGYLDKSLRDPLITETL